MQSHYDHIMITFARVKAQLTLFMFIRFFNTFYHVFLFSFSERKVVEQIVCGHVTGTIGVYITREFLNYVLILGGAL